jgi:hypothetical protein
LEIGVSFANTEASMARSKKSNKSIILVGHVQGDPADLPEGIVYHPGRDPDAPARVSKDVEIITDRRAIEWTRRAYEADVDHRFAEALEEVRKGEWVFLEHRDALKQRASKAVKQLAQIMNDKKAPATGRVRAAETLNDLGNRDGARFLIDALGSPSAELCAEAVDILDDWDSNIDLTQPAVAKQIVKLLSSPDAKVVKNATHLCAWKEVPGAEEALQAAIAKGRGPLEAIADALVRVATKPKSIQIALPHLFKTRQKEYESSCDYYFERVVNHPNPEISLPFRQAMQRYLLTYKNNKDRLGQHWAGDLAAVADESVIPVLKEIIAKAKDCVSRASALTAWARLEPERAVERALAEIKRDRPWEMLIEILARHAVADDFERIRKVLYPKSGKYKDRELEIADANLLLEKLGARGKDFVVANLERFEQHAKQSINWRLKGFEVRAALKELHKANVLRDDPDEILKKAKGQVDEDDDSHLPPDHPAHLSRAIGDAGLETGFDTETGFVPCHHEELIREFAEHSAGRFTPECPIQIWHQQDENDYDGPFTVQFIYRGRLYRFGAENFGDYYDVESVVRALNKALEHNKQPERYIGMYTGDQTASFVFADPKAFLPIAKTYGLPLEEDASAGMRAGRDFEDQVFEDLEDE